MIAPEKSYYSGQYKAEKKHINGGEELEKLKFDTNTGNTYAEIKKHNEETQKQLDKAVNTNLWLAWIAILIGLCLIVAGI